jgi:enamine deaminase RidA (YjgF/YER057c/UK114 family)
VLSKARTKAIALAAFAVLLPALAWSDKKNKEDETQILQLPKELPTAVSGDTRRLIFLVTPLSARGLLSQQVRDALKSLERQAAGSTVLQIRAFVAGTGDLRRVRDLVSEVFTERHQPLPALSLIQAGALPLTGAQVELEAIANSKKDLYAGGLAFLSTPPAFSEDPLSAVAPLLNRTADSFGRALAKSGAESSAVLRLTCYVSSLGGSDLPLSRLRAEYPRAAFVVVQTQRAPQRAVAACEGVASLRENPSGRLEFREVEGSPASPSRVALVGAPHLVFSGSQVSFGYEDADARLAFDRLAKALEPLSVSLHDVAFARFYPLSLKIEDQIRRQLPAFFGPGRFSEATLQFEGLSSPDGGFAVDVAAAKD